MLQARAALRAMLPVVGMLSQPQRTCSSSSNRLHCPATCASSRPAQETKLQAKMTSDFGAKLGLAGWKQYWVCSEERKGQAGVATFSRSAASSRPIAGWSAGLLLAARAGGRAAHKVTGWCGSSGWACAGQSRCQSRAAWERPSTTAWGAA